ncbi:MAG: hypothetical protein SGJ20_22595 [Planctomycetota bacterium]|nr:hypothetical protein [Planctomycetota bacterium]
MLLRLWRSGFTTLAIALALCTVQFSTLQFSAARHDDDSPGDKKESSAKDDGKKRDDDKDDDKDEAGDDDHGKRGPRDRGTRDRGPGAERGDRERGFGPPPGFGPGFGGPGPGGRGFGGPGFGRGPGEERGPEGDRGPRARRPDGDRGPRGGVHEDDDKADRDSKGPRPERGGPDGGPDRGGPEGRRGFRGPPPGREGFGRGEFGPREFGRGEFGRGPGPRGGRPEFGPRDRDGKDGDGKDRDRKENVSHRRGNFSRGQFAFGPFGPGRFAAMHHWMSRMGGKDDSMLSGRRHGKQFAHGGHRSHWRHAHDGDRKMAGHKPGFKRHGGHFGPPHRSMHAGGRHSRHHGQFAANWSKFGGPHAKHWGGEHRGRGHWSGRPGRSSSDFARRMHRHGFGRDSGRHELASFHRERFHHALHARAWKQFASERKGGDRPAPKLAKSRSDFGPFGAKPGSFGRGPQMARDGWRAFMARGMAMAGYHRGGDRDGGHAKHDAKNRHYGKVHKHHDGDKETPSKGKPSKTDSDKSSQGDISERLDRLEHKLERVVLQLQKLSSK